MPTYEYECGACGHEMDAFQNMSADPLKTCPECGKDALKRKIGTGAGIIFKGSGFYETDYKKNGSKGVVGDASKDSGKSATRSESTSETKKESSSTSGDSKKSSSGGTDANK